MSNVKLINSRKFEKNKNKTFKTYNYVSINKSILINLTENVTSTFFLDPFGCLKFFNLKSIFYQIFTIL